MSRRKVELISTSEWIEAAFPVYKAKPSKDSFRIDDIMERTGLSHNSVRSRLTILLEKGELKKEKFLVDGKLVNFYTPVGKKKINADQFKKAGR